MKALNTPTLCQIAVVFLVLLASTTTFLVNPQTLPNARPSMKGNVIITSHMRPKPYKLHNMEFLKSSSMFGKNSDTSSAESDGPHIQRAKDTITTAMIGMLVLPTVAYAGDSEAAIAGVVRPILDNFVNIMSLLFICRTVLSWYPKTDLTKFPYNVAVWPTEPLLVPVRELIPPAFGVDISAIVWVGVLSFIREILTGQQGILALVEKGM